MQESLLPRRKKSVGKPGKLWLGDVEILKMTGVRGWKKIGTETPGN